MRDELWAVSRGFSPEVPVVGRQATQQPSKGRVFLCHPLQDAAWGAFLVVCGCRSCLPRAALLPLFSPGSIGLAFDSRHCVMSFPGIASVSHEGPSMATVESETGLRSVAWPFFRVAW